MNAQSQQDTLIVGDGLNTARSLKTSDAAA
jgi:cation transport ATPase